MKLPEIIVSTSLVLSTGLVLNPAACDAGLTGVVNGDFEAQRATYDAGNSYLLNIEGWYDTPGGEINYGYDTFLLSNNTYNNTDPMPEGDNSEHWPSFSNWGPTWNPTMFVGMAGTPLELDEFGVPIDPGLVGRGAMYQQIGTHDAGMGPITVEFDAMRRLNFHCTGGFNTIQVQLWTGGDPAAAADGVDLAATGATLRDFKQFAAADISYVHPLTSMMAPLPVGILTTS